MLNQVEIERESALRWVRSFVDHSDSHRRQLGLYEVWDQVLTSYLVQPDGGFSQSTAYPLGSSHMRRGNNRGNPGWNTPVVGSETRELVDLLSAKLMLALFGGPREFLSVIKRGREDAKAARTVQALVGRHALHLPTHYFNLNTAIKDSVLFGTGILFGSWCYREGPVSNFSVERLGGIENVTNTVMNGVIYDDVKLRRVDPVDFYPAVGYDHISDMPGVARRFTMMPSEALSYANKGKYGYDKAQVKMAISRAPGTDEKKSTDNTWRRDRVPDEKTHPDLKQMTGLEYWGEVPWVPSDGILWRVITILNGVVVRNVPWFLPEHEIPFYDLRPSVIGGRFWGLSPAEAVRYQQDAANALLMLGMDGTIRSVHPPIIHNRNDEIDRAALRAWRPDTPIASDYPNDVRTLPYSANFTQGFNMRGGLQQEIQRNSGATGAIAGYTGLFNRASAAEYQGTIAGAMDRPEWMAQLLEKDSLPRLGKGLFRFYQMFLPDSLELAKRVGERPEPVKIEDLHADYDFDFIGTRNNQSLQARLASFDRVLGLMQMPQGLKIPADEMIVQFLEDNGYDEAAQEVGDPEVAFENALMAQVQSPRMGSMMAPGGAGDPSMTTGGAPSMPPGGVGE